MKEIKRPTIRKCVSWYMGAPGDLSKSVHEACMKAIDYALEQLEEKEPEKVEEALKRIEKLEKVAKILAELHQNYPVSNNILEALK